jgi:hypothetical protein
MLTFVATSEARNRDDIRDGLFAANAEGGW